MKDLLQVIVYGGLFAVLFLPLIVADNLFFPFITGKNFGFRIIVEIIFAAWILLALLDAKYRPQFSWLLVTLFGFVGVITLAAIFGEHPKTSFWSNYERMDGVVTLIHLALYTVVLSSVVKTKNMWSHFLHTSIGVALYVALYGLGQNSGVFEGGGGRIDSTLGNAAYMAIYMLFHIFFVAFLFVRAKDNWLKLAYALMALVFVYTLLLTGTRGTFIGLVGGSFVSVLYIAIFGARFPEYRKLAIGGVIALVVLGGAFYSLRDSTFVQSNKSLSRIANIDIKSDLVVRSTIWGMALEGVEARPVLGWGPGNFNFVFNQNYKASLYAQEQWFDRVHNIFFDWLIAGGIVGFIAYFSIMGAILYYILWLPFWRKERDPNFNVLERAVILGLLVAYLLHNFVVFDNIISYIFYGVLLAIVHMHVARPISRVEQFSLDKKIVGQVVAPIILVATIATVYFVNIPSYLAAGDLIDALRAPTVRDSLIGYNTALKRDGFGNQEIIEQLVQKAVAVARNPEIPAEERQMIIQRAELELLRLIDEKPGDARLHVFLSNLYRAIGAFDKAREQSAISRSLSPNKPSMAIEQGIIELQTGNNEAARDFFKEAYDLEPRYSQAKILYAAMLASLGDESEARTVLATDEDMLDFVNSEFALSIAEQGQAYGLIAEAYQIKVNENPTKAQNWASLAFTYYKQGDNKKAIETLRAGQKAVPAFEKQATCIISNLETGKEPDTPCTE
ncbi:O-antigen ligase family protein [Candidatus Kaiserbacteria bacterium]|nr:O-antigen ligase family protein [Candidatus Kaiserbacteria bacterium]